MYIRNEYTPKEWDSLLAVMGGHPLQSALWGEAKKAIYGISDYRFAICDEEKEIALFRVENRGFQSIAKLGWLPQGPTLLSSTQLKDINPIFYAEMKKNRYMLSVASLWKSNVTEEISSRKTVWIDLSVGKERCWAALDKQWRYGVRSAQRAGLHVCVAESNDDISNFYKLCISISEKKKFQLAYSKSFLQYILENSDKSGVEAKLFLIKLNEKVIAGAYILRLGKSCHYMWGGIDRLFSKLRPGEFIQWQIIEWAIENNCTLYDLEGIDEIKNPGVSNFKKKMGGSVIALKSPVMNGYNLPAKAILKLYKVCCA